MHFARPFFDQFFETFGIPLKWGSKKMFRWGDKPKGTDNLTSVGGNAKIRNACINVQHQLVAKQMAAEHFSL